MFFFWNTVYRHVVVILYTGMSLYNYVTVLYHGSTACTVVQGVVKANCQSNGKGQILTPWGSETPERISIKLGIYNHVAGMLTYANPCGAVTTWVVWANTWKKHMLWFLRYTFFALFFGSRRARTCGPILTIYKSYDVFQPKDVPFRVSFILLPILGVKYHKNPYFGAWIGIFKLNAHTIEITAPITTKFCTATKTTKYSSWVVCGVSVRGGSSLSIKAEPGQKPASDKAATRSGAVCDWTIGP